MAKGRHTKDGFGTSVPPSHHHVIIWFLQRNQTDVAAAEFLKFYELRKWKNSRGRAMKNWKKTAWDWIWN